MILAGTRNRNRDSACQQNGENYRAKLWKLGCIFISLSMGQCLFGHSISGQEADVPPLLPETEVEAEQPDNDFPTIPSPFDASPFAPPAVPESILRGGAFSSAPVEGYRAPTFTAGTLVDTPNIDFPGTVNVIPEALRHDQQALRIDDLLRDIGGAAKSGDQLRPDVFFLRGFEVRSRDFRKNGFVDPSYTPRDLANVERVEVLKGPSSVLFGSAAPSGTVNFITKKPLDESLHHFTYTFGSFDLQRYTIDSTGRVDEDGTLLYRINTAYENRDSFRDFNDNERTFVAPALTWVIDPDTTITWEGEYLRDNRTFDTGVVAINGDPRALPINRFLGEPKNDFQRFEDYRQSLFLNRQINDMWFLRIGGTSLFYRAPSSGTIPGEFVDPVNNPTLIGRSRQDIVNFDEQYHSVIANLTGEFELGGFEHQLVVGTEQGWFISDSFVTASSFPGFPQLPIDAANPVYTDPNVRLKPAVFSSNFRQNRHGFYFQDFMTLSENWKLLSGVRYDHVVQAFDRDLAILGFPLLPRTESDQSFNQLTPRVGLMYQPIPEQLAFYGTYSRSFNPPSGGPRVTTDPLLPELGEMYELGVKMQLTEQLAFDTAAFYITRQNVTVDRQVSTPPFFVTDQIGEQRSAGFEMNLTGQLTERWSMIGNYTFVDTKLSDPNDPTVDGKEARNVPENSFNLWSRYNFLQTSEQVFGAALGVVYADSRLGDFNSPLRLPSYTRWDAGCFYRYKNYDVALYLENLFDVEYYTSSISQFSIYPGAPFNARATVGVTF